jgi:phosphoglycolate phosphatase
MFKDATIVFDLDGTLVDTAPDLTNALNDVLTRRGHAAVPAETIRACVGHGARVMIEEALRRASAQDDVDRMLAEFLVHYEANIAAESRPFPGAVAALDSLAGQGTTLAVCTNKREHLSRRLLQELQIEGYFAASRARHLRRIEARPGPLDRDDRACRGRSLPRGHGGRQRGRPQDRKSGFSARDSRELRLRRLSA